MTQMEKPQRDGFIQVKFYNDDENVWTWAFADLDSKEGFDEHVQGLTIHLDRQRYTYMWNAIEWYTVKYNSEHYELALLEFQAQCEHVWHETIHTPFIPCYHKCDVCSKAEQVNHEELDADG